MKDKIRRLLAVLKSKWAIAGASCALAMSTLAQESTSTVPEGLKDAVDDLQENALGTIETIRPVVKTILIAMFSIIGLIIAFRWVRRLLGAR